jgi:hypothetical protein
MATSHANRKHDGDKAKLGLAVTLVGCTGWVLLLSKQGQLAQWGVLGCLAALLFLSAESGSSFRPWS